MMEANQPRLCPKCGKTLAEERKFPGLWTCPDSKILLNDARPFRYKCDGMHLTDDGARAFGEELNREHARRNARLN